MDKRIDFDLLPVFETLLIERSVSRAARRLHVSQPAVSRALARLRAQFDDPLFVRTPGGMEPTPRALAAAETVLPALQALRDAVAHASAFDPRTTDARLRVSMGDYECVTLLPRLFRELETRAPGIRLSVVRVPPGEAHASLAHGEVDLVVGQHRPPAKLFHAQPLFEEPFVCLVRAGHRFADRKPGLDAFCSARHILVYPAGTGNLRGFVDRALERIGRSRAVVLSLPHFLAAPHLLRESDAVLTLPASVARLYEKLLRLESFPPPLEIECYRVGMLWHQRHHADPAACWLRSAIADSSTVRTVARRWRRTRC
jgi:DNA-binding transcriptional LysR family regulator